MSWYDEYEPCEPSEVDEIVQEAINKLEEYIIDNSKLGINDIIESAQKWEKKYNECKAENRKFFSMITSKDDEIKELKVELERKRTQFGILPFEAGEEVYYIFESYRDTQKFTCPKCEGKGRVTINVEGEEYNATCPVCKDSIYRDDAHKRESSYHPYKLGINKIEVIIQEVTFNNKTKEPETVTTYKIDGMVIPENHIRKKSPGGNSANESTIRELEDIASALNEERRLKCLHEVGRQD